MEMKCFVLMTRMGRLSSSFYIFFPTQLYGHEKVSILDGGWKRWLAIGGQQTGDIPNVKASNSTDVFSNIHVLAKLIPSDYNCFQSH